MQWSVSDNEAGKQCYKVIGFTSVILQLLMTLHMKTANLHLEYLHLASCVPSWLCRPPVSQLLLFHQNGSRAGSWMVPLLAQSHIITVLYTSAAGLFQRIESRTPNVDFVWTAVLFRSFSSFSSCYFITWLAVWHAEYFHVIWRILLKYYWIKIGVFL